MAGTYDPVSTNENLPTPKKRTSPWIKFGVPVAVLVFIGAVLGGVLGSRAAKQSSSSGNSNGNSAPQSASPGSPSESAIASAVVSQKEAIGLYATATNSLYMIPIYPQTTNVAAFTQPTFAPNTNDAVAWPKDDFKPANPSVTTVRPDRPRLIAPAYKWKALPNLIRNDPYMRHWNDTIFANATIYAAAPPVAYALDGPSGILDNAREIKQRVKAFSYAYRMTGDSKWSQRCFQELQNVLDNFPSGDTKFNPEHFLDTAELTAAYAIAYDWLYEAWTDAEKSTIRSAIVTYGLNQGLKAYNGGTAWWSRNTQGNWNCVCNGGLTMGALAILGDDTTGAATQILALAVPNAKDNCVAAVSDDGSWAEGPNYWYFGTTGHAEMLASLLSATGGAYDLDGANFALTGAYHMGVFGATQIFQYSDHGPNKFSSTANSLMFYADRFNKPQYALHQRDQPDSADPWTMFWYNPTIQGAFWNNLELDHFFGAELDQWASMRSSWTDPNALYVAVKAGKNQGHQTHNDLDVGTFVVDALGTRWAGELGSGDYNSKDYFTSDTQDAARWLYYRKATQGQNTLWVGNANQLVTASPSILKSETTGEKQGSSTIYDAPGGSTALWTADISSAYSGASSVKRGVRLINGRKQVLIQDDITSSESFQWRMHTNATVSIDGPNSATLSIGDKTMKLTVLNAPAGLTLSTSEAKPLASDPKPPSADQSNPGVTVVILSLGAGSYNLQVLLSPQWPGMAEGDYKTPGQVSIDAWSLTSHN